MLCPMIEPLVIVNIPWAVVAGYVFMPVGIIATVAVNVLIGRRTAGTRITARVTGCWYGETTLTATTSKRARAERTIGTNEGLGSFSRTKYK